MVNAFLMQDKHSPEDAATFAKNLVEGEGVAGVGGFSLVCGKVGQPLAVISNRTPSAEGLAWIAQKKGETVALSNTAFGNRSWPKVLEGEKLMQAAVEESVEQKDSKKRFVERLTELLSVDTLPKLKQGQGMESYVKELRNSIFIPAIGSKAMDRVRVDEVAAGESGEQVDEKDVGKVEAQKEGLSGVYGTQKQTVVLVGHDCHVTFVERTLYDGVKPLEDGEGDRWFDFEIE